MELSGKVCGASLLLGNKYLLLGPLGTPNALSCQTPGAGPVPILSPCARWSADQVSSVPAVPGKLHTTAPRHKGARHGSTCPGVGVRSPEFPSLSAWDLKVCTPEQRFGSLQPDQRYLCQNELSSCKIHVNSINCYHNSKLFILHGSLIKEDVFLQSSQMRLKAKGAVFWIQIGEKQFEKSSPWWSIMANWGMLPKLINVLLLFSISKLRIT